MSSSQPKWTWDALRQDHYFVTQDQHGRLTYHYSKALPQTQPRQQPQQPQQLQHSQSQSHHVPASPYLPFTNTVQAQINSNYSTAGAAHPLIGLHPNSASYGMFDHQTMQRAAASGHQRIDSGSHERPPTIRGTPEAGLYEHLDSSYYMRTGAEAYSFFEIGKVFAMLHIQAASASDLAPLSDNITIVKYGERAFSQIRRFIVAEVRRGFVYACPITTYSGQGCLKRGCVPSEHSVVYIKGTRPTYFDGEKQAGLTKEPICVVPAASDVAIKPASRVHYSKCYPIEMNVKVKDIGKVAREDLSNFIAYYSMENSIAPASAMIATSDGNDLAGI